MANSVLKRCCDGRNRSKVVTMIRAFTVNQGPLSVKGSSSLTSLIHAHCDPDPVCDHSPTPVIESDGRSCCLDENMVSTSDVHFVEK